MNINSYISGAQRMLDVLKIDLNDVSVAESKDICFSAVCSLLTEKKWDVIFELKDELTRLVNSAGQTVLGFCIASGDEHAFKILVDKQISVVTPAERGNLPIHIAAEKGNLEFVKILSQYNDLSKKNVLGQTPLHLAAYKGHEPVVRYLLENHVIQSVANWDYSSSTLKLSPFALSIMGGHLRCIDLFLEKENGELNKRIDGIGNLLHLAVFFQQNHILERLLTLYINKFAPQIEQFNDQGQTPLMLAAYTGNERALQLLIQKGAKIDI